MLCTLHDSHQKSSAGSRRARHWEESCKPIGAQSLSIRNLISDQILDCSPKDAAPGCFGTLHPTPKGFPELIDVLPHIYLPLLVINYFGVFIQLSRLLEWLRRILIKWTSYQARIYYHCLRIFLSAKRLFLETTLSFMYRSIPAFECFSYWLPWINCTAGWLDLYWCGRYYERRRKTWPQYVNLTKSHS